MDEMRCIECGAVITNEMKECPNCGYPLQGEKKESEVKENAVSRDLDLVNKEMHVDKLVMKNKSTKSNSYLIMSISSLVLGLVIMIIGIFVANMKLDKSFLYEAKNYNKNSYNVEKYSFGADFYTEIYNASQVMSDELNSINNHVVDGITDINEAFEKNTNLVLIGIETLCDAIGMLIITVGMAVVAYSLIKISKVVTESKR